MTERPSIKWNEQVKLVISDVDETIADVNGPIDPEMVTELNGCLADDIKLLMLSGGSLERITSGITDALDPSLRKNILFGHCSGAEVRGFELSGELRAKPFYSPYESMFTEAMRERWRDIIDQLISEFNLRPHPMGLKKDFWHNVGRHVLDIMMEDRDLQITFTMANGRDISEEDAALFTQVIPETSGRYDLRIPIIQRAEELFTEARLPVDSRLAGNYSIDFVIAGVSKMTAIHEVIANPEILRSIGLEPENIQHSAHIEVWGDKFSVIDGGTDRYISMALPLEVRSIDFREEEPSELPQGYNIVLWDGKKHLHAGLLEYLQSRPRR
jgi:hydroxymethylpyrimidine pyrophosphatase-like HAD family hydrolase